MQVRAHVERQIGLVAEGKADKAAIVTHTLLQFAAKCACSLELARAAGFFFFSFSRCTCLKRLSSKGMCPMHMPLQSPCCRTLRHSRVQVQVLCAADCAHGRPF